MDVFISFAALILLLILFIGLAKADETGETLIWDESSSYDSYIIHPKYPEDPPLAFTSTKYTNYNYVWIKANIIGYAIGGMSTLTGKGEATSSFNNLFINKEDNVKLLSIGASAYGGYVYVNKYVKENDDEIVDITKFVGIADHNNFIGRNFSAEYLNLSGGFVEIVERGIGYARYNTLDIDGFDATKGKDHVSYLFAGGKVHFSGDSIGLFSEGVGNANYNEVYIKNSNVPKVYGGAVIFQINGGKQEAHANNNILHIKNSVITDSAGGAALRVSFIDDEEYEHYDQSKLTFIEGINNTVILEGEVLITKDLYGARNSSNYAPGDVFTGNTLNIINPQIGGIKIERYIRNFQIYNFTFEANAPTGTVGILSGRSVYLYELDKDGKSPLKVQGSLRGSKIGTITIEEGGTMPTLGHVFYLIKLSAAAIDKMASDESYGVFDQGTFNQTEIKTTLGNSILTFALKLTRSALTATLSNIEEIIKEDPGNGEGSGGSEDPDDNEGSGGSEEPGNEEGSGGSDDPGNGEGSGGSDEPGNGEGSGGSDEPGNGEESGGSDEPGNGEESGGNDEPVKNGGSGDDGSDGNEDLNNNDGSDDDNDDEDGAGNNNDPNGGINNPPVNQEDNIPLVDKALGADNGSLLVLGQLMDTVSTFLMENVAGLGHRADNSQGVKPPCPNPTLSFTGAVSKGGKNGESEIKSTQALFGIGCGNETSSGIAYYALFLQGGRGEFTSTTPGADNLSASGDIRFFGAGAMGRFDFNHIKPGHFYLEAAVQGGRIDTSYLSKNVTDFDGVKLSYNDQSEYVGGLLGGGFVFYLGEFTSLDFSAKYALTQIKKSSTKSNFAQNIEFGLGNSKITKANFTLSHSIQKNIGIYVGTGLEYELDGKRSITVNDNELNTTSLKGMSFNYEAGIHIRPTMGSPLSVNIATQGSQGRKKTFNGTIGLNYSF
jgi:hypothetical protein